MKPAATTLALFARACKAAVKRIAILAAGDADALETLSLCNRLYDRANAVDDTAERIACLDRVDAIKREACEAIVKGAAARSVRRDAERAALIQAERNAKHAPRSYLGELQVIAGRRQTRRA